MASAFNPPYRRRVYPNVGAVAFFFDPPEDVLENFAQIVQPAEENLLINPAHPDFSRIKLFIEKNPFVFDPRLFS